MSKEIEFYTLLMWLGFILWLVMAYRMIRKSDEEYERKRADFECSRKKVEHIINSRRSEK